MRTASLILAALIPACTPADKDPSSEPAADTDTDTDADADTDADTPSAPPTAGEVRTITDDLDGGDGLALTPDGLLIVSEPGSDDLRTVTLDGDVGLLSDALSEPYGISLGPDGWIYVANWGIPNIMRVSLDGEAEEVMPLDSYVGNVWAAPSGDLLVPYFYAQRIEQVAPEGTVTVVAESAEFRGLHGVLFDDDGRLVAGNHRDGALFVQADSGEMTPLATLPGQLGNLLLFEGVLYATGYDTHQIYQITPEGEVLWFAGGEPGDADGPAAEARFTNPNGLVGDAARGVLYVSESRGRIREVALIPAE